MASSTVVYCFISILIHIISCTSDSIYNSNREKRALFDSSAKCYANDLSESWYSGANDILVVKQSDGSLKSTLLQLRVIMRFLFDKHQNIHKIGWIKNNFLLA